MGAVYRASEEGLGRKVALKVIAPELAQDERFRERFLRESRIAASLDHPHVVPIYQAGDDDGALFLAMRFVEGSDLAGLLAEGGALEPDRAIELLSQVADALDAAHEKNLVHRDVKPSNILVATAAGKEHCYLGDFGLTKRTGSLSGVTTAGEIVGTLEYVAPEQVTGEVLDERADIYSLACVLYECLTGQTPFPRATDVALLWAHVHEEPTPPSQARSELPAELDAVLARALAKEPVRRQESAGELMAEARACVDERAQVSTTRMRRRRVTRRRLAAAGVVLAVVAAVVGAALVLGGSPPSVVPPPSSLAEIDPANGRVTGFVTVGDGPAGAAYAAGKVWVANAEQGTVSVVDPETDAVETVSLGRPDEAHPVAIAADETVWVALGAERQLVQLNTQFVGEVLGEPVAVEQEPLAVLVADGRVCAATAVRVECFDATDGSPLGRTAVIDAGAFTLASGAGTLWVGGQDAITQFAPTALEARGVPIAVSGRVTGLAFGGGSLWAVAQGESGGGVSRLAVGARAPQSTTELDGRPTAVVYEADAVTVAVDNGTVARVSPTSSTVSDTFETGGTPSALVSGGGRIWLAVR
jgi:hypothetical protein